MDDDRRRPMLGGAVTDLNTLNEYGVPLHACWGYRHDAHYWAWVATWCGDGSGVRPPSPA